MWRQFSISYLVLLGCVLLPAFRCHADTQTATQTLSVNVLPHGKVSVPASVAFRASNTRFGSVSAATTISYWARTSTSGVSSMTVQAVSDFAPAGGPSISSVTVSCSAATLGTSCSGGQVLSIGTQASLVSLPGGACTGGGGACSTQDPNTVLLTLSAPSKPTYKTGSYSAQIVVTISSI
jgi:hypothetical protein